jgi:nucleoside-diphosphate-sugar epimerase
MGTRPATTAFVTNPAGFVGAELVSTLVARGLQVLALTPSPEAASRVRSAGATAVMGELLTPGRWQDEVAADWVFHLPPPLDRRRIGSTQEDADRARVSMDGHVLDAVAAGSTRRIVYVASLSRSPVTNTRPITEDELPAPCDADSWHTSLDCLEGYALAGLPIVTGLPGCIYGNGGWFRDLIVEPVMAGRRVWLLGQASRCVSPIHVRDCARALVHLADRGERGRRYFIANSESARIDDLAHIFARVANRRLRLWRLPAAARVLAGRRRSVCAGADTVLSNVRLRGTGFQFEYPTVEEGCRQILRTLDG